MPNGVVRGMSAPSPYGRCVGRHRQLSVGGGGLALPSPRQTQASCQLRAGHRSKRKTVGDDLDAPLVLPLDNKVEVTQEHVGRDGGRGLTANPSSGSLEWDSSRAQQTRGVGRRLGGRHPKHRGGACKGRMQGPEAAAGTGGAAASHGNTQARAGARGKSAML